jgi:hypothetical protein
MQRRLLAFFAATRACSDRVEWSFTLLAQDNSTWSEAQLATSGMPPTWVVAIAATAHFPVRGKFCRGFFTTYRVLPPRHTARNLHTAAATLVADVLAEFTDRECN